jgi:serine/threonine protein kinase
MLTFIFQFDGTLESVAIKEFRARSEMDPQDIERAWDREARALREMGTLSHPHIVKLIATFTRGNKCYLMFQWANGGNLRDLWRFNI